MNEKTEGDVIIPSVSVVIPIYNVEPFLRKCVDSVINQTLKDIEIILVDDGSTDSSGDICNEYKARDTRVRVIHKQNKGLSCAKNDGIDASTAPYIMFVDGDDWVHEEFCERPYNAAMNENADLVVFRGCVVKNGKQIEGKDRPVGLVDAETAIKFGGSVSWNKLYRRDLLKEYQFPEGMVYEDIAITHRIVFAANRIVMLSDALYYHVYRQNSISNCNSAKNKRDGFISALQFSQDMKSFGCKRELYEPILMSYALGFMAKSKPCNDSAYSKAEEVLDSIKEIPDGLSMKKKVMFLVWKANTNLFHFVCRILGQKDPEQN